MNQKTPLLKQFLAIGVESIAKHKNDILDLPSTTDDKHYELENLHDDQVNTCESNRV